MRPALFLDRDGVINVDHGYVGRSDDFEVIGGVFPALRRAQEQGYALIVVTNQSGIARGYFTLEAYEALEAHMRAVFAAEGIHFAGIYHCPHHVQGKIKELSVECDCRKPLPGMILRAAREHDIDLARSILVGDKESDAEAGRAAGVGHTHVIRPPEQLADILRAAQA